MKNIEQIEGFFGITLPRHIRMDYKSKRISKKLNQQQIMEVIDFKPPFLRIDKMIVFDASKDSILQSKSLGIGVMTPRDTAGHYNDSIFLAMCGRLMGSSASIHLATLFPSTAPQAIEVDHIRPSKDRTLWKPSVKGSSFFVETCVIKKKLQIVIVNAKIFFGEVSLGEVDKLKLILIPKRSIWGIKELPPWR